MRQARNARKPIIWGIGATYQDGLAPVLIDLMKRGFITAIATNGSVLVHDAEIALVGSTSEDVDPRSEKIFWWAEETGQLLNQSSTRWCARRNRLG